MILPSPVWFPPMHGDDMRATWEACARILAEAPEQHPATCYGWADRLVLRCHSAAVTIAFPYYFSGVYVVTWCGHPVNRHQLPLRLATRQEAAKAACNAILCGRLEPSAVDHLARLGRLADQETNT